MFEFDGVVDKYIGDCIMSVFGTLEHETDSVFKAVSAALRFQNSILLMNEERCRFNRQPISIGVGLNTGI